MCHLMSNTTGRISYGVNLSLALIVESRVSTQNEVVFYMSNKNQSSLYYGLLCVEHMNVIILNAWVLMMVILMCYS